jgi:D-alanyl-D-alanine carboxypeptidase/D-alanyl-D-alanine-endopeptidase (penicillin-binding protein 4)
MKPGRRFERLLRVAAAVVACIAVLFPSAVGHADVAGRLSAPGVAKVQSTILRIERKSIYARSNWGYEILDQRSGRIIAAQDDQKLFDPGSTMKVYSVATALRDYGPQYRFVTPVYRQGTVSGGTLTGNLAMVASGDLTFGLRQRSNGTLYYDSLPKLDHSYADQIPGAVEPPGDPFAALNELAAEVRAAGITNVNGDVVIDDRLFSPHNFLIGLETPMWVNENLIDLLVTPTSAGQRATLNWRPMTATYAVTNDVITVGRGGTTTIDVTEPTPGQLVVSGQIAAGSSPTLRVWEVDNPSEFARTAFIEALRRAGVTVTAPETGANPTALLPPKGSYSAPDLLGSHVSPPLSEYAKLILKVSYERGANLMTCLAAVKLGSSDCLTGLVAEVRTANSFGVSRTAFYPFDGAGTDDKNRTSPGALATFVRGVARTRYANAFFQALPILGRDGTLADLLRKSKAAGRAQMKTGNRVLQTEAGQIIVFGNTLAGYILTKSGRRLAFAIAVGNVAIKTLAEFQKVVTNDQARMVEAIQQGL